MSNLNRSEGLESDGGRNKWGKLILVSGAVAAWQIYELASPGKEKPSQSALISHYIFLGCAAIGLIGSKAKFLSQK